MNILLITSAEPKISPFYTSEKRPPLGLGFVMAVLKKAGHRVFFRDNYLKPSDVLDSDFLTRNKIDFVGIYSNTICYQSTLEYFRKLQKKRIEKIVLAPKIWFKSWEYNTKDLIPDTWIKI